MGRKISSYSISYIVKNKICNGCGTCTVVCPSHAIKLYYGERFNYPIIDESKCIKCKKCLLVCPAASILEDNLLLDNYKSPLLKKEAYLIYSQDKEIRNIGASGGFISGLLIHLLERGDIDGCIVTKCEEPNPLIATSFIAKTKSEILSASGSIYAPVSNCATIKEILGKSGKYVFVGTPCMVEGIKKLETLFPELKTIIVLKIAIVCSGIASRLSTKKFLLKEIPHLLPHIKKIRYRGNGWPGNFIVYGNESKILYSSPYSGQNGILKSIVSNDHYLRCELCFDHFGKFADISVSDPWCENILDSEKEGISAVLVHTNRGKEIIDKITRNNLFNIEDIPPHKMINFNKHLLIDKKHPTYIWYLLYNVIFLKKLAFISPLILRFFQQRIRGLLTIVKTYLNKNYYY